MPQDIAIVIALITAAFGILAAALLWADFHSASVRPRPITIKARNVAQRH